MHNNLKLILNNNLNGKQKWYLQIYLYTVRKMNSDKIFPKVAGSIVNEVIRPILNQFICFFPKRFWAYKKHQKATLLETVAFVVSCLLISVFVGWFWGIYISVHSKSFHKEINWFEIVLITSFTILLTCTPINPSMENQFVCIYFYL